MKIAIITSGRLPVPATNGGAVETKLDYILDYNAIHHYYDLTVYSIKPLGKINKSTKENHYIHYSLNTIWSKIQRKIYNHFNKRPYYDETIEFFLHKCLQDIKHKSYDCFIIANRPGFAIKLSKITKKSIILQINNDYLNKNTKYSQEIMQACSLIITCSDYLNRQAQEVPCNKKTPIITVHNGIDISRFINANPINRTSLGLSNDDFIIFYSGRLTKEKGVLELIRAIKNIKSIPNLKLIITGASFYGKDSCKTPFLLSLQEEAEDIQDQVIFTGFVDYIKMPQYLKTADIIVVPSLWEEPFGLTVLEAMAAGKPLIATRCGGIPEICENVSVLIERKNICKNLIDAIEFLYNNPQYAKLLSTKAQERSLCFDKDIFSKEYLDAIQKAL